MITNEELKVKRKQVEDFWNTINSSKVNRN